MAVAPLPVVSSPTIIGDGSGSGQCPASCAGCISLAPCRRIALPLAAKRAGASFATGSALRRTTMRQLFAAAVMLAAAALPAAAQDAPSAAVLKDLAPTGKLRAGVNFGNPVLAQKGPN